MPRGGKERITVRLSSADIGGLKKIQASGDFEDMSATVRWCIHFSSVLLKLVPAAIISSFVETEEPSHDIRELRPNDTLENTTQQPFSAEKA